MKNIAFLALVIGSSACGNITGKFSTDASTSDSGPSDGGTDASITQMVNVVTQSHVTGGGAVGAAANNIEIIALRPNGTMSDNKMTDATGSASVSVYPGGSVTAFYPHLATVDKGADFVTYVGVQGGDNLTFGVRNQQDVTPTTVGTIMFTWPTYAGATYYYVSTPCGEPEVSAPTLNLSLTVNSNCNRSPFQVEFYVYSSASGYPAYASNQITTVGPSQTIQNFGWSSATDETLTLSATGLPAEVTDVEASASPATGYDTELFSGNQNSAEGAPTGNAFAATLHPFAAGSRTLAELDLSRPGGFGNLTVLDGLQTFAQQWTVASPPLPPWTTGFVAPTGSGQVQWFMDKTASSAAYNGTVLTLSWSRLNTAMTAYDQFNWNIILPPDTTSLTLPVLPAAVAPFAPGPNDAVYGEVMLLNIPSVTGYDGLRALPEKDLISPTDAVISGDVARVIYSQYGDD